MRDDLLPDGFEDWPRDVQWGFIAYLCVAMFLVGALVVGLWAAL